MEKFKPGDRLVVVKKDLSHNSRMCFGWTITVTSTLRNHIGEVVMFKESPDGFGIHAHEVEFEHVVNSPLYQALR